MYHGHSKVFQISSVRFFLRAEICWGEVLWRVVPYLVGKQIYCLLTDYVVVS